MLRLNKIKGLMCSKLGMGSVPAQFAVLRQIQSTALLTCDMRVVLPRGDLSTETLIWLHHLGFALSDTGTPTGGPGVCIDWSAAEETALRVPTPWDIGIECAWDARQLSLTSQSRQPQPQPHVPV